MVWASGVDPFSVEVIVGIVELMRVLDHVPDLDRFAE